MSDPCGKDSKGRSACGWRRELFLASDTQLLLTGVAVEKLLPVKFAKIRLG